MYSLCVGVKVTKISRLPEVSSVYILYWQHYC